MHYLTHCFCSGVGKGSIISKLFLLLVSVPTEVRLFDVFLAPVCTSVPSADSSQRHVKTPAGIRGTLTDWCSNSTVLIIGYGLFNRSLVCHTFKFFTTSHLLRDYMFDVAVKSKLKLTAFLFPRAKVPPHIYSIRPLIYIKRLLPC